MVPSENRKEDDSGGFQSFNMGNKRFVGDICVFCCDDEGCASQRRAEEEVVECDIVCDARKVRVFWTKLVDYGERIAPDRMSLIREITFPGFSDDLICADVVNLGFWEVVGAAGIPSIWIGVEGRVLRNVMALPDEQNRRCPRVVEVLADVGAHHRVSSIVSH